MHGLHPQMRGRGIGVDAESRAVGLLGLVPSAQVEVALRELLEQLRQIVRVQRRVPLGLVNVLQNVWLHLRPLTGQAELLQLLHDAIPVLVLLITGRFVHFRFFHRKCYLQYAAAQLHVRHAPFLQHGTRIGLFQITQHIDAQLAEVGGPFCYRSILQQILVAMLVNRHPQCVDEGHLGIGDHCVEGRWLPHQPPSLLCTQPASAHGSSSSCRAQGAQGTCT
mmetsp:Transcript_85424/g.142708  ORF Transcript_85424/g.142708 Transcript_85424/m.142708 type:complete len:222 (-) Transcript_85424:24-689(-)